MTVYDVSSHHVTSTETFGIGYASVKTLCSISKGNSVNCLSIDSYCVHSNGTHTECSAHVLGECADVDFTVIPIDPLMQSLLLTLQPQALNQFTKEFVRQQKECSKCHGSDLVVSLASFQQALAAINVKVPLDDIKALLVRTGTQVAGKSFTNTLTPYFTVDFMNDVSSILPNLKHLLCDLPSVDRVDDSTVSGHRAFFSAAGTRTSTITELCSFASSSASDSESEYSGPVDGIYSLNLQLIPFPQHDAVPSRPLLISL
jgi:hypothetical protein